MNYDTKYHEAEADAIDRAIDRFTEIAPRFVRAALYALAAFALSFAVPNGLAADALVIAVLVLSIPKRSILLADIILAAMVILAILPPAGLRYIGL